MCGPTVGSIAWRVQLAQVHLSELVAGTQVQDIFVSHFRLSLRTRDDDLALETSGIPAQRFSSPFL